MSGSDESAIEQPAGRLDRRAFLRTVGSGAYALGVAHLLGVDSVLRAGDGTVTVTTALVRDDPDDPWSTTERTRAVPEQWYESVSKAFEINDLLARSALTGYLGSAVVPGRYEEATARITVEVTADIDGIRETIDRITDGITVDFEAIDDLDELEDDRPSFEPRVTNEPADNVVPGGIACHTDSSIATLCPALYHPEREQAFFATAQHAFVEGTDENPLRVSFSDGPMTTLGSVTGDYHVADVATIEPSGEYQPGSAIHGRSSMPVLGQFTRFGLADLVARGEPLEKVGALSGQTSGHIQGIDAVSCIADSVCRRGQLRWGDETDMTDGDSGSVSFHADPENPGEGVLVAGFNNARTWWPGQSYVWGISAHHFSAIHGYHF